MFLEGQCWLLGWFLGDDIPTFIRARDSLCTCLEGFLAFMRNAAAPGRLQPLRWIWPRSPTTSYPDQTLVCMLNGCTGCV